MTRCPATDRLAEAEEEVRALRRRMQFVSLFASHCEACRASAVELGWHAAARWMADVARAHAGRARELEERVAQAERRAAALRARAALRVVGRGR